MVVAVLEEERHHHALEEIGLEDFQTASMWHPRDDVMKLFLGEDGVEFDGEFLDANGALEVPSVVAAATATAAASSRGIVVTGVGLFRHVAEVTVFVEMAVLRSQSAAVEQHCVQLLFVTCHESHWRLRQHGSLNNPACQDTDSIRLRDDGVHLQP